MDEEKYKEKKDFEENDEEDFDSEKKHNHDEEDIDSEKEHNHDEKKENHEKHEVKIDNDPDNKVKKFKNSASNNPWMISTIIVGIIAIVLLYMYFNGGGAGGISGAIAGEKVVEYLNARTGGGVEYISYEDMGNLYQVTVSFQGQNIPVFISKDGEYFIQGAVPMANDTQTPPQEQQQQQDIVKSDKPEVELFVWSYCPYGVQAQGPLAKVVKTLGTSADFEAVLYHDGHGAYETQQNKIQACIQEIAKDKYWDYATGFVDDIYPIVSQSRNIDEDKSESIKLMKSLGIDDSAVMDCVDKRGTELIAEHVSRAQEYGVTGSPSVVINGVKVNVARNAEALKTAVCNAFNTAPSDCSTTLDSSDAAAAGNC